MLIININLTYIKNAFTGSIITIPTELVKFKEIYNNNNYLINTSFIKD